MQTLRKKIRFTYTDYLQMPSERRYELVDGDFHMVAAPLTYHQKVLRKLYELLAPTARNNEGELFFAPVDVVFSEEDVVQPDLIFISKARLGIITEKNVSGAPELVVEILSPSTRDWDRSIKKRLYEKFGVQEYWIVDPEGQSLEILSLTEEGFQTFRCFQKNARATSPYFKELSFSVEQLF
ncbi:MAG: Uma2 family endonuclease [Deltaproteobacteria bacterium]|nr:Uma2 family endonuclease [Deltaproteobacteria bacterium]